MKLAKLIYEFRTAQAAVLIHMKAGYPPGGMSDPAVLRYEADLATLCEAENLAYKKVARCPALSPEELCQKLAVLLEECAEYGLLEESIVGAAFEKGMRADLRRLFPNTSLYKLRVPEPQAPRIRQAA